MDLQVDEQNLIIQIAEEHNKIRKNPQSYVSILKDHLAYFKENVLSRPGETAIQTHEGAAAYEEAIKFLQKQSPVEELTFNENIAKASDFHAKDIGPKGLISHDSSDGKNSSERLEEFCEWHGVLAENIEFGSKKPENIVVSMLVDDGVSTKIHRENLFLEDIKFIGVGVSEHKDFETVCVIDYVGGVREVGEHFFDAKNYKYQYPVDFDKKKTKKPKTSFQLQDDDAPDDTVSIRTTKSIKLREGKVRRCTKKFYTLKDGSTHIVEVEEV